MIAQIVVGSGSKRTVVEPPRDRDVRRVLGNKIKGFLFPTNATYKKAQARGKRALAMAQEG